VFCHSPAPYLFKIKPDTKTLKCIERFDKLRTHSRDLLDGFTDRFIGVLYDKRDLKTKEIVLYLENESNVVTIDVTDADVKCFMVSGCTYIANGPMIGRNLVVSVKEMLLPNPIKVKDPFPKKKFDEACRLIAEHEK
jgi:hypothetical protein